MDSVLYFFRDKITGIYYFIYAFICLLLMFSIIGYLFKQKYAKVEVKLNTSQPKVEEEKTEVSKKDKKKIKKDKNKNQNEVPIPTVIGVEVNNQTINPQVQNAPSKVVNQPTVNQTANVGVSQTNVNQENQQEITIKQEVIEEIPEI